MKAYTVKYRILGIGEKQVSFLAKNKADAYDKAVYEIIPAVEGELPYSAWVYSVTYNNGNQRFFNTSEGNAWHGLKIISHNTSFFTAAFLYDGEGGKPMLMRITYAGHHPHEYTGREY